MTTNRIKLIERLAARFAAKLAAELTAEEFHDMRLKNASDEYAGDVCASHDYCDANMVMDAAWREIMGRKFEMTVQEDAQLWTAAFDYAHREYLTAPIGVLEEAARKAADDLARLAAENEAAGMMLRVAVMTRDSLTRAQAFAVSAYRMCRTDEGQEIVRGVIQRLEVARGVAPRVAEIIPADNDHRKFDLY